MGCCFEGNTNQIPINFDKLFGEVRQSNPGKFAYYVDGEVQF